MEFPNGISNFFLKWNFLIDVQKGRREEALLYFLFALFSFFHGRKIFPHPKEESFDIRRGNLSLNHGDIPVSMLE